MTNPNPSKTQQCNITVEQCRDIESQLIIFSQKIREYNEKSTKRDIERKIHKTAWFYGCMMLMIIPFATLDIYVASASSDTCILQSYPNTSLTIRSWFVVWGFYDILIFLNTPIWNSVKYAKIRTYIFIISGCFNIIWGVLGGICIWKYMILNTCSSFIYSYTQLRTIVSFIGIICSSYIYWKMCLHNRVTPYTESSISQ
jgi:hypothetical protein